MNYSKVMRFEDPCCKWGYPSKCIAILGILQHVAFFFGVNWTRHDGTGIFGPLAPTCGVQNQRTWIEIELRSLEPKSHYIYIYIMFYIYININYLDIHASTMYIYIYIKIDISDRYQWLHGFMAQNWVVDQTDMFFFTGQWDKTWWNNPTKMQPWDSKQSYEEYAKKMGWLVTSDGSCTVILKETNIFVGWGAFNVERNWIRQHVWCSLSLHPRDSSRKRNQRIDHCHPERPAAGQAKHWNILYLFFPAQYTQY